MANVRRLLGKLAAKISSPEPSTCGLSPDRLTPHDIAMLLGFNGLSEPSRLVVRVKWGLCEQDVHRLVLLTTKEMIRTAKKRKWRTQADASVWWRLAVMALREAEVVSMANGSIVAGVEKCRTCRGIGIAGDGSLRIVCPSCKGTSRYLVSQRRRAGDLGVDKKCWKKTWEPRFNIAVSKICTWEGIAIAEMRRRLS